MPALTLEQLTVGLVATGGLAFFLVLLVTFQGLRMRRLRREYAVLRGDHGPRDIFEVVRASIEKADSLEHRVDGVVAAQQELGALSRLHLQKFALVRYDAFGDMGGQLSFSAALLDDRGDGLVITSINGRTETRTYAKPIRGLASVHNLSEEELEAIGTAFAGYGRGDNQPAASGSH